jgi:hypothetical protein
VEFTVHPARALVIHPDRALVSLLAHSHECPPQPASYLEAKLEATPQQTLVYQHHASTLQKLIEHLDHIMIHVKSMNVLITVIIELVVYSTLIFIPRLIFDYIANIHKTHTVYIYMS